MGGMLDFASGEEFVAGSEIVGLSEIIGAIEAGDKQQAKRLIKQLAQVKAAGGVMVVPRSESMKYKIAPFVTQNIGIGGSTTFNVAVQEMFRPQRLILGGDPNDFLVTSIKVGTKEQLITPGGVPGSVFAPDAWGSEFQFDTASVGTIISVGITNLNPAARDLYAAFLGVSVG